MKYDQIIHGSIEKCTDECATNDQCKSFDFCRKNSKETFCHLKDQSTADYKKSYNTGNSFGDYVECRSNIEPFLVGIEKPLFVVGEN